MSSTPAEPSAAQPRRAGRHGSADAEGGSSGLEAHPIRRKPSFKPGTPSFQLCVLVAVIAGSSTCERMQVRSTAEVLLDKHAEDAKSAQTKLESLPVGAPAAQKVLKVDLMRPVLATCSDLHKRSRSASARCCRPSACISEQISESPPWTSVRHTLSKHSPGSALLNAQQRQTLSLGCHSKLGQTS